MWSNLRLDVTARAMLFLDDLEFGDVVSGIVSDELFTTVFCKMLCKQQC
jgi:hypothetical protein